MSLFRLTAHELHDLLKKKEISAQELNTSVFNRIESVEDRISAYITLTKGRAFERAQVVDRQIQNGEEIFPLSGIPVALKDNICTRGIRTTAASKMLADFIPPYSATVVKKLDAAGVAITGKTNMDEFAMGSSTENSAFFPTKNPWDTKRAPGGSSGGSAAAVASGEAICALGSDTGGSIRQPASFCGVVGMKPTYGMVSRYGVIAYASSFDQVGPLAKDVTDCALMLNAICGHDPLDSTSVNIDIPDYTGCLINDVRGLKIGVPGEYMSTDIDSGVREKIEEAIATFNSLGAIVEHTTLPHSSYVLPAYYIIAPAEAGSNMARFDGVRYGARFGEAEDVVELFTKTRSQGFGPEVKRRIMLGTFALSEDCYDAFYQKALKVRTLIKEDFDRAYEKFDLLLSPTAPSTAFRLGEKTDDPYQMYLADIFTASANLAGIPAITIPCGFVDGLPVGLQLMGGRHDEATLIRAAYNYEQNTEHHRCFPSETG